MILVAALALAAAFPASMEPADPLGEARAAFAAEDYARAERLALSVSAPQDAQAALYLAGLARFRAGRPAEALDALDRAAGGADSRAAWQYNRAACLHELGRLAEAERAYLEAADDAALAPVALVGAGFAALEAGDAERARAHAGRARAAASGRAVTLVGDLEAELSTGGAAPPLPRPAAPARRVVPEAAVRLGGGWDSDARRSALGASERPTSSGAARAPSHFGEASARVATRLGPGPDLGGELSYELSELLYQDPAAADRSVQQHGLGAALLLAPGDALRLDLGVEAALAFAGRSDFRAMVAAGGLRVAAALDHGPRATSRLELAWWRLSGRGAEFAAQGGDRAVAALAEELRLGALTVRAGYRLQLERIGTSTSAGLRVPPSEACPDPCTIWFQEPLAYAGHAGWAEATWRPRRWLELRVAGGAEWRRYDAGARTVLAGAGATAELEGSRRHDVRGFAVETATLRVSERLAVFASHEVAAASAPRAPPQGPRPPCPPGDPRCGDGTSHAPVARGWAKQVLSIGTELRW